jgi:hypothetical protein
MALRIGLLGISAVHNDKGDVPIILHCRTPQETNPKSHWGSIGFLIQSLLWRWWCSLPGTWSWLVAINSSELPTSGKGVPGGQAGGVG